MNELSLAARIEAILFTGSEPISRESLSRTLKETPATIEEAITSLKESFAGRGIALVDDGREIELRTAPEASELIEAMRKEELSRDIGKAGLETLAILLYKGPSSRSEVDFIRGVNSSHILRSLATRGLVRRKENPADERSFIYEPTTELLAHVGVASAKELPDFGDIELELKTLLQTQETPEKQEHAED